MAALGACGQSTTGWTAHSLTGCEQSQPSLRYINGHWGSFLELRGSVLLSTPEFTGAFVPLSKEDFERSEEILADMLRGKPGSAPLGALYVSEAVKLQVAGEDPTELSLHPGTYRLVAVTANKAEIVDSEGNVRGSLPIKVMQVANTTPTKLNPEIRTHQNGFEVEVGPNCIELCAVVIVVVVIKITKD